MTNLKPVTLSIILLLIVFPTLFLFAPGTWAQESTQSDENIATPPSSEQAVVASNTTEISVTSLDSNLQSTTSMVWHSGLKSLLVAEQEPARISAFQIPEESKSAEATLSLTQFQKKEWPISLALNPDGQVVAGLNGYRKVLSIQAQSFFDKPLVQSMKGANNDGSLSGFALATQLGDAFFLASMSPNQEGKAWICRIKANDNGTLEFENFIDVAAAANANSISSLTASPDGFLLVCTQDREGEDSIAFFDPEAGALRARFILPNSGLVGLGYGPNQGRLYCLVRSTSNDSKSGLYKIVGRKRNTACELQLVHAIPTPIAMAFADDGRLFIAAANFKQDARGNELLMIKGLDYSKIDINDPLD